MAHYTFIQLSDLLNHFTELIIVQSNEPLEKGKITTLFQLPECRAMDPETGKLLTWSEIEKTQYVQIGAELTKEERINILAEIENYHRDEVDLSKEFLGL